MEKRIGSNGPFRLAAWAVLVLIGAAAAGAAEEKQLFNGKDLTGWDGDEQVWSVVDGVITGRTSAEHPIKHNTAAVGNVNPRE